MNMTDEVRHCSDGGCPLLNAVARSAREQPPYARRRENHAPRASGSRPLLNEDFPYAPALVVSALPPLEVLPSLRRIGGMKDSANRIANIIVHMLTQTTLS